MDPITILSGLSVFAPILARWMGASDSVQSVADKASALAAIATGKTSPEDILNELKSNQAAASQFQLAILAQEGSFETLYMGDKANARARDIALSASPAGNVRANYLASIAIGMVVGILAAVIFYPNLNDYARGVITTILGVFLNQLTNIYNFEFGTTRRSRDKSEILNSLANSTGN